MVLTQSEAAPPTMLPVDPAAPSEMPTTEAPATSGTGWTLAEVEQIALANNPTLAQAYARVNAAEGRRMAAGVRPNPRVGYQANEIGQEGAAGQQGLYFAQEILTANKRGLDRDVASYEIGQRQSQHAMQQQRVLASVRIAFYDLLAAQRGVELAEELVRVGEAGVEVADARLQAGLGSRVDVLQARVEANKARVQLQNARNRQDAASSQLAALVGTPQGGRIVVDGNLVPGTSAIDTETVLAQILASSPELLAAQHAMGRAQAALRRAQAERVPNFDVQTGIQYDDATDFTVVNLQVEVPIPLTARNDANIWTAQAEWTAASRNVERLELELRSRFAAVVEEYSNASYEIERYRSEMLPDARENLQLVSDLIESGELDYLRMLTAQRTYFETELEFLQAVRNWWQARLTLDGLLLTGGLETPER